MMNILFLFFCLVTSHISVDGIHQDVKFEIKSNPTSSIKTINTNFGNIIDCVDIYKQPAFDHPLLKNHKLQLKPNFDIEETTINSSQIESTFKLDEANCPEGTIPIQRTIKDNLDEEKLSLNHHILVQDIPGVHLAEVSLKEHFGPYYKVSGTTSIFNPPINRSQISMSHMWVENGPVGDVNKISAGWHVDPGLYGNNKTHFYSTWTSDNFKKTGCYNLRCPGFVQIDRNNYLGALFPYISVYGGPIYEIHIAITQDSKTKNWWLSVGKVNIGYYPWALFVNLERAIIVGWGGRTATKISSSSPQMGSGHFPDGMNVHACYFRNILIEDSSRHIYKPRPDQVISFADVKKCYDVHFYENQRGVLGGLLQYGGPGGDCGN